MSRRGIKSSGTTAGTVVLLVVVVVAAIASGYVLLRPNEAPVTNATDYRPAAEPSRKPTPEPVSLDGVRSLVAEQRPLTVSVLGDSTGNDGDEWVAIWGRHLAETNAVTYHAWDDVAGKWLNPVVYSTDGPAVTIWNMSAPGRSAAYPSTMIRQAQPQRPDVVLYNFGHNNTDQTIGTELEATVTAVERRWGDEVPGAVMLQNPEAEAGAQRQELTVAEIRKAVAPEIGLAAIDVWAAFGADGRPLRVLLRDGVHPGPVGSQVWADAVIEALG